MLAKLWRQLFFLLDADPREVEKLAIRQPQLDHTERDSDFVNFAETAKDCDQFNNAEMKDLDVHIFALDPQQRVAHAAANLNRMTASGGDGIENLTKRTHVYFQSRSGAESTLFLFAVGGAGWFSVANGCRLTRMLSSGK